MEPPVKPGVDPAKSQFKSAFGMKVKPEGPQNLSQGPVEYWAGEKCALKVRNSSTSRGGMMNGISLSFLADLKSTNAHAIA